MPRAPARRARTGRAPHSRRRAGRRGPGPAIRAAQAGAASSGDAGAHRDSPDRARALRPDVARRPDAALAPAGSRPRRSHAEPAHAVGAHGRQGGGQEVLDAPGGWLARHRDARAPLALGAHERSNERGAASDPRRRAGLRGWGAVPLRARAAGAASRARSARGGSRRRRSRRRDRPAAAIAHDPAPDRAPPPAEGSRARSGRLPDVPAERRAGRERERRGARARRTVRRGGLARDGARGRGSPGHGPPRDAGAEGRDRGGFAGGDDRRVGDRATRPLGARLASSSEAARDGPRDLPRRTSDPRVALARSRRRGGRERRPRDPGGGRAPHAPPRRGPRRRGGGRGPRRPSSSTSG